VNPSRRGAAILFTTAAAAYLLDRLSKLWAENRLEGHPIVLIKGVLTLQFTTNSGGAFSLGQSAPWLFAGFTLGVAVLIVATAFRQRSVLTSLALGLVLGGALGNLTDRIVRASGMRGRVIDFIDLHIWPVFNVADSAVVVGALLLGWSALRSERADADATAGGDG
jgi:signal peptidase II